jgi:hypothetical protein
MRLALAPKVAVVEEDTAGAEEDEVVTVASNHRHSTYIIMII